MVSVCRHHQPEEEERQQHQEEELLLQERLRDLVVRRLDWVRNRVLERCLALRRSWVVGTVRARLT